MLFVFDTSAVTSETAVELPPPVPLPVSIVDAEMEDVIESFSFPVFEAQEEEEALLPSSDK